MEEDGYIWRLWNNFGGEASVYKEREDISIQEVLEYRLGTTYHDGAEENGASRALRTHIRRTNLSVLAKNRGDGTANRNILTSERYAVVRPIQPNTAWQRWPDAYE